MNNADEPRRITPYEWMPAPSSEPDQTDILARCTDVVIGAAVAGIKGAELKSVNVNRAGSLDVPTSTLGVPAFTETDLPVYCQAVVHQTSPAGSVAEVLVWVPLVWNGRFLGTGGGGTRTTGGHLPRGFGRSATLASSVRNGFASARTDGGVGTDPRPDEWVLDEDTGQLDSDLFENWAYRSTHEMTVIGKAVTAAIHGRNPDYSYFQGFSGGGRQALAQAQRYPDDYDGVWAGDPGINWTRTIPAMMWPPLVMKELGALAPEKFDEFRSAAVIEANGPGSACGWKAQYDESSFDANRLVGQVTEAGEITENDAIVMNKIWQGPVSPTGEQLWFGLRPGVESWGGEPLGGQGICLTSINNEGHREPKPFALAHSWLQTWLLRDPEWDWRTLTFDEYAKLFEQSVTDFAPVATDDPDLAPLRNSGAKLLVTQGAEDQVIAAQGTRLYFDQVFDSIGGVEATAEFARLFLCPGDGHSSPIVGGFGVDLAIGMIALMKWVENGVAPETLEILQTGADGTAQSAHQVTAYRGQVQK